MSGLEIAVLCVFLVTYVCLLLFPRWRAYVALASAIILVLITRMSLGTVFSVAIGASGANVLMMIAGTMVLVVLFTDSGMPTRIADALVAKSPNAMVAIVALALFAGIISAFVDNVATVLMVAPVALAVCKKQEISPVLPIIAIAVSSNLQGAATLVGDTTSIILGEEAGMSFADFFVMTVEGKTHLGIFWAVEAGALVSSLVLFWIFRHEKKKLTSTTRTPVTNLVPTILMVLMIALLILVSFFPKPAITNGIICLSLAAVGLIHSLIREKGPRVARAAVKGIDFQTLLLLASLFVVIESLVEAGLIDRLAHLLGQAGGGSLFAVYTIIVFASVLISAFIDNIPYVMTMLPVVTSIAASLGAAPYVLYFGLLIGATLGGNLTPIGASANITAIGILRKAGHEVKTREFMRVGVPFTLVAVLVGYALIWAFWS